MGAAEMEKISTFRCSPFCELVWVWLSGAESALLLELLEELSWVCFTSSRGLVMTAVILTTYMHMQVGLPSTCRRKG